MPQDIQRGRFKDPPKRGNASEISRGRGTPGIRELPPGESQVRLIPRFPRRLATNGHGKSRLLQEHIVFAAEEVQDGGGDDEPRLGDPWIEPAGDEKGAGKEPGDEGEKGDAQKEEPFVSPRMASGSENEMDIRKIIESHREWEGEQVAQDRVVLLDEIGQGYFRNVIVGGEERVGKKREKPDLDERGKGSEGSVLEKLESDRGIAGFEPKQGFAEAVTADMAEDLMDIRPESLGKRPEHERTRFQKRPPW